MKRTFIAVPVDASAELENLIDGLKEKLYGEALKWVNPCNLHITLNFLGNTTEDQISSIMGKLETLPSLFKKQKGKMTGLNYFSNQGNPSVLFSRLTDMPELDLMVSFLSKELEQYGFPVEQQKFRSHLTLARIKFLRNKNRFYDLVNSYQTVEIQPVTIEKIVFFESILLPQGPIYVPLKTVLL
jgi:RNA 2',3'-cyclic 3'-phosphodiesterase